MCGTSLALSFRAVASADLAECGSLDEFPAIARVPGTARIVFAMIADTRGIVEKLIDKLRRRWDFA
jgi:hypothetical protein